MKENVVFIRPSKIAGTSLAITLSLTEYASLKDIGKRFRQRGWVHFGHIDYNLLVKEGHISKAFDDTAYKFSFVRNPYDRAVSVYFDTKFRRRITKNMTFLQFCRSRIGVGFKEIGLHHKDFNSTFSPMSCWLRDSKLDFLGRFENLLPDFAKLAENLGLDHVELQHRRRTYHGPYMNYYCPESLDIIEHAYREDFERYNYPIHNRQCAGSVPSQPL